MTRADRVLSTPPTNTPIDTTRRRFLTVAAGASFVGAGSLAAAAMAAPGIPVAVTSPPASPGLRAAAAALRDAKDRLTQASAANDRAEALSAAWEARNPMPKSRKGRRRWLKRLNAYREPFIPGVWQALLQADADFAEAQAALAATPVTGMGDLRVMIAAAELYDGIELVRINRAPIARAVVAHIARTAEGAQS